MSVIEQPEALAKARAQVTIEMRDFFDALYAGTDTEGLAPEELALIAARARAELLAQQPGAARVSLTEAGRFSLAVAVNDDRPFLFDSAVAAAVAGGARIRNVFHPVLAQGGRKLSLIVLVVELVPGEEDRARLIASLEEAFADGARAVRDWRAMLARLKDAREELSLNPPRGLDIEEDIAFLDWLADNHFTFLGAREYRLAEDGGYGKLQPVLESGLGILSDTNVRVLFSNTRQRQGLAPEVRAWLDSAGPLIVTKSSARATVHRRVAMDYVGIKLYDGDGIFIGEQRFVGLFTSSTYSLSPEEIPLLRRKIAAVEARAALDPRSHDGKALAHVLENFPRDELFQASEDELHDIALGITRLAGLPRVRVFLRFDRFDRFVSVLAFVPRNRLTPQLRLDIHRLLSTALDGEFSSADEAVQEGPLMRLHFLIARNQGPRPNVDVKALEEAIAIAMRTWQDGFVQALSDRHGATVGRALAARWAAQFSPGYRSTHGAADGARDLEILAGLVGAPLRARASAWRRDDDEAGTVRLKLYVLGEVLPLSQTLPLFENCGLTVIAEDAFPVSFAGEDGVRREAMVLDFLMRRDGAVDLAVLRQPLEDVLHAVLRGDAEDDGFNRLVIGASLGWREVTILRAAAKYLRQAGIAFSLAYMQQALAKNPEVAKLLVALFVARTHPVHAAAPVEVEAVEARIEAALADVASLDDDRIIRRLRNVIRNILRTNYFQPDDKGAPKPVLSFKLNSAGLDELPAPRPWREIFVYSPEVEGVHLRFGRIARGGLRWSDRREDFRTEILGLVKAQQVKNAVIVPVGAKGGFFPKQMPANPSRDQFMATGVAAYKTFIHALLDITDNLDAHGKVIPPANVLRPDGDDPYLVVAADKGTATFSDIANGIAIAHNFWLGDAFASGGSKGYDHKKMGITARGAWEAVKRHFREMGRDIQSEDFTVVGVGDMSGDVFGNGMLLSRHIRLVAAFDHRHIFLDPNAPTEEAFVERERLFNLPRSSWDDYNKELIGAGGGIFPRSLKSIPLTAEVRALIGTDKEAMSPPELINTLLKAKTDLLWFGGIGTYIKASTQSHLDAGDRASDAVRINGAEVRASVIGEGANLGATQLGRIEAARAGVRLDTDAVDNSAGVDTSDHEVNLKILLSGPARRGELPDDKRDELLAAMTDDVARLVLADNYDQTLALSVSEHNGVYDLDAQTRLIADLEARGKLDRAVEYLPSHVELKKLEHDGAGLTRPELAVLMAYAKLDLDAALLESDLPSDPALHDLLLNYFPDAAVKAFPGEPDRHRLKTEIVSTVLTNKLVNLAGPVFMLRVKELSGRSDAEVARAFVIADGAYGLSALKARIDALDGKVKAASQLAAYAAIAAHLQRVTPWFAIAGDTDIAAAIALYRGGVEALRAALPPPTIDSALPSDIGREVALLPLLAFAPEIARLAQGAGTEPARAAALYKAVGTKLGLDRLRALAGRLVLTEHWDRLAVRRLLDDLTTAQRGLTARLLAAPKSGEEELEAWGRTHAQALQRTQEFLATIESSGELSVAKLLLIASQIQALA